MESMDRAAASPLGGAAEYGKAMGTGWPQGPTREDTSGAEWAQFEQPSGDSLL